MLNHFDQLYCKTYDGAKEMGLIPLTFETKWLGRIEGLYLVMPLLVGRPQDQENKAFYLTGDQDLKAVVDQITQCSTHDDWDTYYIRNPYAIYFTMEESHGPHPVNAMISLERFETVNDILKQFDWVYPMVAWSQDKAYFRSYTKYCYDNNTVIVSTLLPFRVVEQSYLRVCNNPRYAEACNGVYCGECSISDFPYLGLYNIGEVYDDFMYNIYMNKEYFLHTIMSGKATALYSSKDILISLLKDFIENYEDDEDKCSITNEELDDICKGTITRDKISKLLAKSKSPYLEALAEPLPFKQVPPTRLEYALCPSCYKLYNPPFWYRQNMKYYTNDSAHLYLCLKKYGVPWDIIMVIMCFRSMLEYCLLP